MLSFFALLHIHVCVKKILLVYELDACQFGLFLQDIEGKYLNALAVPGHPNGTNASQVLGATATQNNFNVHRAASSSAASSPAIQRVTEITTASKKMKEPSMDTYLDKDHQTPQSIRLLVTKMKMITLGNVIQSCHLLYDPLPNQDPPLPINPLLPKECDEREIKWNAQFEKEDAYLLETNLPFLHLQGNRRAKTQYHNYSEYVVRLELDRGKLLALGKNIYDVMEKIQDKLLDGKHLWIVSSVFASRWIIRIRMNRKAPEFSKRVKVKITSRTEKQTVQCLVDILMTKITFNGLNGIKDVTVHEMETVEWHPKTLEISKKKEFYLVTEGTNLQEVLNLPGVDHARTISNDVNEVNQVLGIDAAANVVFREISKVLDGSKVEIDPHHLHVLKTSIGKSGYFERCSRFGFGRNRKRGWMKRCSFEELVRNLKESALAGEVDDLQDNASCTMVGKHVPLGTHGPFEIFEDLTLAAERASQQPQPCVPEVFPLMNRQELEGIIPILVPPYTPLQFWCQPGLIDNKVNMDYRWKKYEMGNALHTPDYNFLLKIPICPKEQQIDILLPSITPKVQTTLIIPPLELLDRKSLREFTLQDNVAKKCRIFIFKRKLKKPTNPATRKRKSQQSSSKKSQKKKRRML